ncbi:Hsp20/alpha crystallin family protein [Tessaracoccus antarcticus]|uniref:Hsp20/alpha crystallin family protein n=1 Tax=Tessaracoccus antarcticus TaxID=2479848 RepID=A0A3M0GAV3_9ACTN|nr:Hsp20/alpha crystallin family protein [Tessaracoccus antarcticus]RMB62101.1 Hsp20/alpha crystallin family protein [Tessaracoccus antarcticus]
MTLTFDPIREMDRVFSAMRTPAPVGMPMDLFRADDHFIARIDLPGVDPQTIDIDVEDRTLTVRADRMAQSDDDIAWLVHERPTGTFARQLTLGYGVAADRIEADYADGVLTLSIPVAEEAKSRKIQVSHSAGSQMITGSVSEDPEKS